MKSAFRFLVLVFVMTFFSACGYFKDQNFLHVDETYHPPKGSTHQITYLAYIPTEISTRYTLSRAAYETLSPQMDSYAKDVAKEWNRKFPAILQDKGIGIIATHASLSSLTLSDKNALHALFTSKIRADIREVRSQRADEEQVNRLVKSKFVLLLSAEMSIIEPASGELMWSKKSDLGEIILNGRGDVPMATISDYIEGIYTDLASEMIARLEVADRALLIVPTEEMRIMKGIWQR
ncbi:MAG: hypothetical protein ACTTJS_03915 [Wolinella sp.]